MEDNLFQRVAKALIRNGIIAGKAEAFLVHLLSKSKQQLKYPIIHNKIMHLEDDDKEVKELDSDLVISDLEPGAPEEEDAEYEPDDEFEEEVDYSSYLEVNY
jgi:hypothetical protein